MVTASRTSGKRSQPSSKSAAHSRGVVVDPRARRRAWLAAGLLALLVLAAYLPVWHAGYIWDDDYYLTKNEALTRPGGLADIWLKVGTTKQYYPLVFTTFWIERHVWGLHPLGYHLVNVLLHAGSAVLLWRILRRLAVPGAYLAAAFFAVHPVQVESVAWVAERKNMLSGVLVLGSLAVYLRFARLDAASDAAKRDWRAYVLSLILLVAALLSKTVVASLPAVILLLIWWKRNRIQWADVLPLVPMIAVGVTLGLTTAWVEKHVVAYKGVPWHLLPIERLLLAGRIPWFYLGKLIWPHPLLFSYERWSVDHTVAWQFVYPAATLAVLATLWFARHRLGRGPLVAVLIFVGVLFPALGFFNVYPMQYSYVADHFQYHACMAMLALIAATLTLATRRLGAGSLAGVKVGAAGVLVAALGVKSFTQARLYEDCETLWSHTLANNPQSWVAHLNLASQVCWPRGDRVGFVEHLEAAVHIRPSDANSHKILGDALSAMGQYDRAAEHYRAALQYVPDDGQMHHNLANILADRGQLDEAVMHYRACIRLIPNDTVPHYSLALAFEQHGRYAEAVQELQIAVQMAPAWHEARRELAWVLATCPDEKVRNAAQAVEFAEAASQQAGGNNPLYLDTLAAALAQVGRFAEAADTARQAAARAGSTADPALQDGIQRRLALYIQGRAFTQNSGR